MVQCTLSTRMNAFDRQVLLTQTSLLPSATFHVALAISLVAAHMMCVPPSACTALQTGRQLHRCILSCAVHSHRPLRAQSPLAQELGTAITSTSLVATLAPCLARGTVGAAASARTHISASVALSASM